MGATGGVQASYQRIFDAAMTLLEEQGAADRNALLERFPECEKHVDKALRAITSYHRFVQDDRSRPQAAPRVDRLASGTRLGEYEIIGPLGEGGMGVVYRARQPALGEREVALKVLRSSLVAEDPRLVERFRREASLASRVQDPHVAQVYDYGKHDGQPYFTMQLIEGRTLAEVLAGLIQRQREGWTQHIRGEFVRQAVRLVRDLASGLAAIHSAGLVHRDVKPSNVILAGAGVDDLAALQAKPVLVDFGLVRTVGTSDLTGTLTRLGTPAFASPEAMLGREVEAPADVFSLGAILHDLLCLTGAGSREPASSGLRSARSLNPAVDERLNAIVHMALEERAELRYANGAELYAELECYLRSEPVKALPQTIVGRARLWARRYPDRAIGLIGVGLTVSSALGIWTGAWALPIYQATKRAEAFEQRGDLLSARSEWRTLDQDNFAFLLPFMGEQRAQARKYWDSEDGVLWEPLRKLEAGKPQEAQIDWLNCLRHSYPSADAALVMRFLARELREGKDANHRSNAAMAAARFLLDPPPEFRPPHAVESPEAALVEALLMVVKAQGPEQPAAPMLVRSCASALGGTSERDAFVALLPLLANPDVELRRIASVATIRLWWKLRGPAEPGAPYSHPQLQAQDQAIWVSWAKEMWEGTTRYHLPGEDGREPIESSEGPSIGSCVIASYAEMATCLAWTRMELSAAGKLDREAWSAMPSAMLEYIEGVQHALEWVADGSPAGGYRMPSAPFRNSTLSESWLRYVGSDWIERTFNRWSLPNSHYAYDRSRYEPQQERSVQAAPEFGAMSARVTFIEAETPEKSVVGEGTFQRLEWRGKIGKPTGCRGPSLELTGLGESAVLVCKNPQSVRQANIIIYFDFPAVWPLPLGVARAQVAVNGGDLVVERSGSFGLEILSIPVHEPVLRDHPNLEIEIKLLSGWMLWIHEIRVEYLDEPMMR